jgi:hypothetical protein
MQMINRTKKCDICGCVALLDSKICPKCGNSLISHTYESACDSSDNSQISQLIKMLEYSNGVNIRFSYVNKRQIDVEIFSACSL